MVEYNIDGFYIFKSNLIIEGWAFSRQSMIKSIGVVIGSSILYETSQWFLGKDVELVYGDIAKRCRFEIEVKVKSDEFSSIKIVFFMCDGSRFIVDNPGYKARAAHDKNFVFANLIILLRKRPC